MDNAQNEHGNNDDGSTTLTKMKNTSSVIGKKVHRVDVNYHILKLVTYGIGMRTHGDCNNVHELLNRPDRVEKFSFPVALQARKKVKIKIRPKLRPLLHTFT